MTTFARLIAVFAALVSWSGVAMAQLPPPPVEAPRPAAMGDGVIEFSEPTFDFGNIWDHAKVSHDFAFTNTGTETLTILDVQSSCGCTVPELTKKRYEPGESGKITVVFNPENRSNAQHKTITVKTNSSRTPQVSLKFQAFVQKVLDVQPSIANLGRIYKNEEHGMKLLVLGSTPEFKAWPAKEQPEGSPFRVELVEEAEAPVDVGENGWNVFRVWVEPGLAVGRHSGEVLLKTNDDRRPEVQVRGVITVVGDLQARQPRFALGRLEPGEEFESTVTLLNRVADPFKITRTEVTGEAEGIEVSFKPTVEGKSDAYEVTVRGIAPGGGERILGRVIVHTDMESEPTYELPVYGFVVAEDETAQRPGFDGQTRASSGG